MKAIIPVAGAGTKLRPHTYTQPKALIPLAGKTILSIIVDQLRDAGVTEFIFIIGYLGEKIQDYVSETYPQLKCHFVQQSERHGTGHAINLTRDIVQDDEVLIILGDTIAEFNIHEVLSAPHSMLAIRKVDDPRNFGVAEMDEEGFILRVVEKPSIPKSNMALVGVYKIKETQLMFSCIEKLIQQNFKKYEEFSLTEALDCMMQNGARFKAFKVENWFDCGKKESLLQSNAIMLKKRSRQHINTDNIQSTIIIDPVWIADGCIIRNSVIGPNVAIGENTIIRSAIIRDSIIGSYSNLAEIVLDSSLIGSDAEVRGVSRHLNIGDNTAIDLGGNPA